MTSSPNEQIRPGKEIRQSGEWMCFQGWRTENIKKVQLPWEAVAAYSIEVNTHKKKVIPKDIQYQYKILSKLATNMNT